MKQYRSLWYNTFGRFEWVLICALSETVMERHEALMEENNWIYVYPLNMTRKKNKFSK